MRLDRAALTTICWLFFFGYAYQTIAFTACINIEVYKYQGQSSEEYLAFLYKGIAIVIRCFFASGGNFVFRNKDSIGAISTAVVAIFTYTLWRSTDGLHKAAIGQSAEMKASIKATEASAAATQKAADAAIEQAGHLQSSVVVAQKTADAAITSANAAKESADAFINSRRAHFMVANQLIMPGGNRPEVITVFTNVGETIAKVITTKTEIHYGAYLNSTRSFKYTTSKKQLRMIERTQTISDNVAFNRSLNNAEITAIKADKSYIFLFGYIIYFDIFGNKRERGFAAKFIYSKNRFFQVGNKEYNYEKCTREEDE